MPAVLEMLGGQDLPGEGNDRRGLHAEKCRVCSHSPWRPGVR